MVMFKHNCIVLTIGHKTEQFKSPLNLIYEKGLYVDDTKRDVQWLVLEQISMICNNCITL